MLNMSSVTDVFRGISGLSLKKTQHMWLLHAKITFYCYFIAFIAIMLLCVISIKLNIGKKITRLGVMTLNSEKIQHVSKLIELMFKGELHCLQGCFIKQTYMLGPLNSRALNMRAKHQFVMTLSLNLLVCWGKICKQCVCFYLVQQKSLRN